MGTIMMTNNYETIQWHLEADICHLQIFRPNENNTINGLLVKECLEVLALCEQDAKIIILEGLPEVFCFGADFKDVLKSHDSDASRQGPEQLYDLWYKLASGPYITVAHVRGKTNAGGIGFVASCDVVLSEEKAVFSLSELLFGLIPACVMPFLIRRMGFAKAHYMTAMTQPISAQQAHSWGLVDAYEEDSVNLLRKHLLRLGRLTKSGITQYKRYMNSLNNFLMTSKDKAIETNLEVFTDHTNLRNIARYAETGKFPWEGE